MFNVDISEIIEERKRNVASRPKRVNLADELKHAENKKRIDDIQYNLEIERILRDEY